jgi:hypothetical protein
MKKFILFLLILVTGNRAFSQEPVILQVDRQLDSLIHATPAFDKVTIIYLHANTVHVDTVDFKKYKFHKSDSAIVIKLKDKTEKHIKQSDFWGMTTAYSQRLRFYNGRLLTLWRSDAPYVYKAEKGRSTFYFFSETPTGPVYPLSPDLIDSKIQDPETRLELYAYANEQQIHTNHVNEISHEFGYAVGNALFNFTLNSAGTMLGSLFKSLCK